MSGILNSVELPLDDIVSMEGIKGYKGRGRGNRRGGARNAGGRSAPVTSTQQQHRKSVDQHKERSQKHRNERNRNRRSSQQKAEVVPVVFGNGTPEKVLTGRLTEAQVPVPKPQPQPQQQRGSARPASLVDAALMRGRETFLKSQAHNRGVEHNKKLVQKSEPKRHIIQQPSLSRKLRIVRPGEPGYRRQMRELGNRRFTVTEVARSVPRLKQQQQQHQSPKRQQLQQPSRRVTRVVVAPREQPPAPQQRLLGPQSRRIALGTSSAASSGPLSSRFSSLNQK